MKLRIRYKNIIKDIDISVDFKENIDDFTERIKDYIKIANDIYGLLISHSNTRKLVSLKDISQLYENSFIILQDINDYMETNLFHLGLSPQITKEIFLSYMNEIIVRECLLNYKEENKEKTKDILSNFLKRKSPIFWYLFK